MFVEGAVAFVTGPSAEGAKPLLTDINVLMMLACPKSSRLQHFNF